VFTWPTAFADANYTVVMTCENASQCALGFYSKTASSFTITCTNLVAGTPVTPTSDIIAIHD
jgi:hypothetical protein